MQEPLPGALAALVSQLEDQGFRVADDESRGGYLFRQVTLTNDRRTSGRSVKLTKDRGLWDATVEVAGEFHNPHDILLALDGMQHTNRAMSHEERRQATLDALERMPAGGDEMKTLCARLQQFREEYNARFS